MCVCVPLCVCMKDAQDLCPALDLLHSAIRDTYAEAQSPQFCEQLLNITLNFLNTQIRVILHSTTGNALYYSFTIVHVKAHALSWAFK